MKKNHKTCQYSLISFLVFSCLTLQLEAQSELEQYKSYFEKQLTGYRQWLEFQEIHTIAEVDGLVIENGHLQVRMKSAFSTDDSLKYAWENQREHFYSKHQGRLEELMFNYCAFLMQISSDSLQINIYGVDSTKPVITIHFDQYVVWESSFPASMEGGVLTIPLKDLALSSTVQNIVINSDATVYAVTSKLKGFFYDYYSKKGTIFYDAVLDTSDTYMQTFIYRVVCLNKEVISDGYFEYIEVKVEVEKIDNNIAVKYDIFAAYASGILCPKFRETFYTPIGENNYPGKLRKYSERIKLRIENLLKYR